MSLALLIADAGVGDAVGSMHGPQIGRHSVPPGKQGDRAATLGGPGEDHWADEAENPPWCQAARDKFWAVQRLCASPAAVKMACWAVLTLVSGISCKLRWRSQLCMDERGISRSRVCRPRM